MSDFSSLPHWQQVTVTRVDQATLPIAVAILVPTHRTQSQTQQLTKTLQSVAFAQSIWLGETESPIVDFAAARNSLKPQISESWILWLDSDEWFESVETVRVELQKLLSLPNISGAYCYRQDWFLGQPLRYGEPVHVRLLRLVKVAAGHFHRPVHEVFTVTDGGSVADSQLTLQHASHTSVAEFLADINRYAYLEAQLRHQTIHPSKMRLVSEFLTFPKLKFLVNFFWLSGWRDGWRGLVYAIMMSLHSAAVRVYGWELLALAQQQKLLRSKSTTIYEKE